MSKIRNLILWLPPKSLFAHLFFIMAKKVFNRHASFSYAQSGEDLLLSRAIDLSQPSFYIDVGCNHPIRLSNTYFLYLKGWCGIAIDGNATFSEEWKRRRPRDKFIHACISDRRKQIEFKVFKSSELSSISGDVVKGLSYAQYKLDRVEILETQKLDDILVNEKPPPDIGLLSIDIEGEDFAALRSIDLVKYRPRVIIIELHDINVSDIACHEVSQYLEGFGYFPFACQMSNVVFRAQSGK